MLRIFLLLWQGPSHQVVLELFGPSSFLRFQRQEKAEHVARQATAYCIQDGELYRKRPNDMSLRCISREQGKELLADIHGGDCGHHSSSRTLISKVFCSGFYWPIALNDATELVKACEACHFHAKQIHQPAGGLQTIPLS